MLIAEITIAVLLGIIVIVGGIYVTYFSYNNLKINKTRVDNNELFLVNINKKTKILPIALSVYFALSLGLFITNLVYRSTPYVNGQYYVSVNSNSMSKALDSNTYLAVNDLNNRIAKYDIAVFKKVDENTEIKKYDIILFKKEGKLITHRIIEIQEDEKYRTQGDNNLLPDDWIVERENIIGIHKKNLKFMSFLNYLTYTPGFYVAMVGVTYIIGVSIYFEIENEKLLKKVKEQESSMEEDEDVQ